MFRDSESNMKKDVRDLAAILPEAECRYAVFEHKFKTDDGRATDRLYFLNWLPRGASDSMKMLYTTARVSLKAACPGCTDLTGTTRQDLLDTVLHGNSKDEDEASDAGDDWMD